METSREKRQPVRVGVAGLNHDHVFGLLRREEQGDVTVVGIAEPDMGLAERYAKIGGYSMEQVYPNLAMMVDAVKPEAVLAYNSIFDHRAVVEVCAPRGIHVMVEKPLAVSLEHAEAMARLARRHAIHLLTNYETSWYASTYAAYQQVVTEGRFGAIRKVVAHDGHRGPVEIGCTPDFLAWLTDPALNGGGAVIDFGCYGANLITWLMGGQAPESVTALIQTLKPGVYPKVDDDATILLAYPGATGIIQGSWNWPVSRKDLEIYGQQGQLIAVDGQTMRARMGDFSPEETITLSKNTAPLTDPFSYLAAVVRGEIQVQPGDLASLENNLTVVAILDAARESASTGARVKL